MTQAELADAIGDLADLMFTLAADMRAVCDAGGPEELDLHADELEGAAEIATGWAQGLREGEAAGT